MKAGESLAGVGALRPEERPGSARHAQRSPGGGSPGPGTWALRAAEAGSSFPVPVRDSRPGRGPSKFPGTGCARSWSSEAPWGLGEGCLGGGSEGLGRTGGLAARPGLGGGVPAILQRGEPRRQVTDGELFPLKGVEGAVAAE